MRTCSQSRARRLTIQLGEGLESDLMKEIGKSKDDDISNALDNAIQDIEDGEDKAQAFDDAVTSVPKSKAKVVTKILKPLAKKHKVKF